MIQKTDEELIDMPIEYYTGHEDIRQTYNLNVNTDDACDYISRIYAVAPYVSDDEWDGLWIKRQK